MKLDFTGRRIDVPEELRKAAGRKLPRLQKLLPGITQCHVVAIRDRHRRVVEVTVHSRGLDLSASSASSEWSTSLLGAVEKLEHQVAHVRGKRRKGRKGAATPRRPRKSPAESTGEGAEPRIMRSRARATKPMTVTEAAAELAERSEGVFVFRDSVSDGIKVLFRRSDGRLGLIDAEE